MTYISHLYVYYTSLCVLNATEYDKCSITEFSVKGYEKNVKKEALLCGYDKVEHGLRETGKAQKLINSFCGFRN